MAAATTTPLHRRERVPSHTSSKSPKNPNREHTWNPASPIRSGSANAAGALQRRAPVRASVLVSTLAVAGQDRDSCAALRVSRVQMPTRRRCQRQRLRRANDRVGSAPQRGHGTEPRSPSSVQEWPSWHKTRFFLLLHFLVVFFSVDLSFSLHVPSRFEPVDST
jgi:hypothetical protein